MLSTDNVFRDKKTLLRKNNFERIQILLDFNLVTHTNLIQTLQLGPFLNHYLLNDTQLRHSLKSLQVLCIVN